MKNFKAITVAAVSLCATTALAAESVGEIMVATDATSVSGQVGKRTLTEETELFVGDLVATGAGGQVQVLFNDSMIIALAANTSLGIDKFPDDAAREGVALHLRGGSMRVVLGGSSDESNYTFKTDWATVIPLGTAFDLTALPDGGAEMLLLRGKAKLCGEGDDCEMVETPCGLLKAERDRKVEEIEAGKRRVQEINARFPFATPDSQSGLLEPFRIKGLDCANGGLAPEALARSAIPTEAIVAGTIVIIGGVVGVLLIDNKSNNNTND